LINGEAAADTAVVATIEGLRTSVRNTIVARDNNRAALNARVASATDLTLFAQNSTVTRITTPEVETEAAWLGRVTAHSNTWAEHEVLRANVVAAQLALATAITDSGFATAWAAHTNLNPALPAEPTGNEATAPAAWAAFPEGDNDTTANTLRTMRANVTATGATQNTAFNAARRDMENVIATSNANPSEAVVIRAYVTLLQNFAATQTAWDTAAIARANAQIAWDAANAGLGDTVQRGTVVLDVTNAATGEYEITFVDEDEAEVAPVLVTYENLAEYLGSAVMAQLVARGNVLANWMTSTVTAATEAGQVQRIGEPQVYFQGNYENFAFAVNEFVQTRDNTNSEGAEAIINAMTVAQLRAVMVDTFVYVVYGHAAIDFSNPNITLRSRQLVEIRAVDTEVVIFGDNEIEIAFYEVAGGATASTLDDEDFGATVVQRREQTIDLRHISDAVTMPDNNRFQDEAEVYSPARFIYVDEELVGLVLPMIGRWTVTVETALWTA
jgi:hypothetical protein